MAGERGTLLEVECAVTSAERGAPRLLEHVAEEVRTLFARNNVDIIAAFESFDRDGNRTIDPTEFRTGLTDLNIGLSAAQIDGVRTISSVSVFTSTNR